MMALSFGKLLLAVSKVLWLFFHTCYSFNRGQIFKKKVAQRCRHTHKPYITRNIPIGWNCELPQANVANATNIWWEFAPPSKSLYICFVNSHVCDVWIKGTKNSANCWHWNINLANVVCWKRGNTPTHLESGVCQARSQPATGRPLRGEMKSECHLCYWIIILHNLTCVPLCKCFLSATIC